MIDTTKLKNKHTYTYIKYTKIDLQNYVTCVI